MPRDTADQVDVRLFDRANTAEDALLTLERALLPLVVWDGLEVQIEISQGLSVMERFVIACLKELGSVTAEDLREVVTMPADLAGWLLNSLAQKTLAFEDEPGRFRPDRSKCDQALETGAVPLPRKVKVQTLWLPDTNEFILLKESSRFVSELRHLCPVKTYPMPDDRIGATRGDVFTAAIENKQVYGEYVDQIYTATDEQQITESGCPVYVCSAVVPQDGQPGWYLGLTGRQRHRGRSAQEDQSAGSHDNGYAVLEVPTPKLSMLTRAWSQGFVDAETNIHNAVLEKLGIDELTLSSDGADAVISGDKAEELSENHLLFQNASLQIRLSGETEYTVPVRLKAADARAQARIDMDHDVRRILANGPDGWNDSKYSKAVLIDRMWVLGMYRSVYEMRADEDFAI